MAKFYLGLASLEEVDAEAWFAGTKTKESKASVKEAIAQFRAAIKDFDVAVSRCSQYQEWFPGDRQQEVTPDIQYFGQMVSRIENVVKKLAKEVPPDLKEIHEISAAMRNEMIVAERKGLAHRGTRHHFPSGHR